LASGFPRYPGIRPGDRLPPLSNLQEFRRRLAQKIGEHHGSKIDCCRRGDTNRCRYLLFDAAGSYPLYKNQLDVVFIALHGIAKARIESLRSIVFKLSAGRKSLSFHSM
jgi:hypothetical protein